MDIFWGWGLGTINTSSGAQALVVPSTQTFQGLAPIPSGGAQAAPLSISQIADGAGWKTTVLANTDTVPASFTLQFWHADGSALSLPLISQGSQQQVTGTIPVNGSMTIETAGGSGAFSQGWGQLTTSNSIGGTTIFRQSVPGRQDSEAAVRVIRAVGKVLVLPYDNTGPQTLLALVNPDSNNSRLPCQTCSPRRMATGESPISRALLWRLGDLACASAARHSPQSNC
jgi:hypothetical protein